MMWFGGALANAVLATDILPSFARLSFGVITAYPGRYSDVPTEIF